MTHRNNRYPITRRTLALACATVCAGLSGAAWASPIVVQPGSPALYKHLPAPTNSGGGGGGGGGDGSANSFTEACYPTAQTVTPPTGTTRIEAILIGKGFPGKPAWHGSPDGDSAMANGENGAGNTNSSTWPAAKSHTWTGYGTSYPREWWRDNDPIRSAKGATFPNTLGRPTTANFDDWLEFMRDKSFACTTYGNPALYCNADSIFTARDTWKTGPGGGSGQVRAVSITYTSGPVQISFTNGNPTLTYNAQSFTGGNSRVTSVSGGGNAAKVAHPWHFYNLSAGVAEYFKGTGPKPSAAHNTTAEASAPVVVTSDRTQSDPGSTAAFARMDSTRSLGGGGGAAGYFGKPGNDAAVIAATTSLPWGAPGSSARAASGGGQSLTDVLGFAPINPVAPCATDPSTVRGTIPTHPGGTSIPPYPTVPNTILATGYGAGGNGGIVFGGTYTVSGVSKTGVWSMPPTDGNPGVVLLRFHKGS